MTTMPGARAFVALGLAGCLGFVGTAVCQVAPEVGKFTKVRGARVRPAAVGPGGEFVSAKGNASVHSGDMVRTGRRNFAEITFKDTSILRVNEYTDLLVYPGELLRRIELQKGAIWMRVARGSGTSVQTPVATATVRGTEFTLGADGELTVIEGEVILEAGGKSLTVVAGESAEIGPDGTPRKKGVEPTPPEPGKEEEKPAPPWWNTGGWAPRRGLQPESIGLVIPLFVIGFGGGGRAPVPEPASALLLAAGFGIYAAVRRRAR